MFKTIATTLAAAVGVANAQSWTDPAGFCPSSYKDEVEYNKAIALDKYQYFPKQDKKYDDPQKKPSLDSVVFEFDKKDKVAKCMYFWTQGLDGKPQEQSERFCVDAAAKEIGDQLTATGKTPKGDKYEAGPKIPLWNVAKIGTTVVKEKGIVDMTFTMRYTNFSSVAGNEKEEIKTKIQQLIDAGELPEETSPDYDWRVFLSAKVPDVLSYSENGWKWTK